MIRMPKCAKWSKWVRMRERKREREREREDHRLLTLLLVEVVFVASRNTLLSFP